MFTLHMLGPIKRLRFRHGRIDKEVCSNRGSPKRVDVVAENVRPEVGAPKSPRIGRAHTDVAWKYRIEVVAEPERHIAEYAPEIFCNEILGLRVCV